MTWTNEKIKDYWYRQANKHKNKPAASWSDFHMIELEIQEISKYLRTTDEVLDVGCANGFSTLHYFRKIKNIKGIDYIPQMIVEANKFRNLLELDGESTNATFEVDNILSPKEKGLYDKIICTRVLINLNSRINQIKAIKNMTKLLKKGGYLLLSEASYQGWERLNAFRNELGLENIPIPPFNYYLDIDVIYQDCQNNGLILEKISDFASSYYIGTRVLKPILAEVWLGTETGSDYTKNPLTKLNELASKIPPIGDYGIQELYVLRKI